MPDTHHRILGITGWKNSGKTTLTEKLVSNLVAHGYRIATIKHAHHAFDIDHEGRDSYRHRKAGASEVAIVSSKRWALIHELENEDEPPLNEVLARLAPCDLVIIEGYKREGHDKIEVRRAGARETTPISDHDPSIIALVSDINQPKAALPAFDLDDVEAVTRFVMQRYPLHK
ncbi:MAG: molybdopterin-guanine dinucleotide biosynthesis protein B [Rhizobiaceae bacterium]